MVVTGAGADISAYPGAEASRNADAVAPANVDSRRIVVVAQDHIARTGHPSAVKITTTVY
jgi:hypothetical protein